MSETTDRFWANKKAREELAEQIDKHVQNVIAISDVLAGGRTRHQSGRPWQWVRILSGGNIPSHLMDSPLEFNLRDWPDIRNLSNLISQWHGLDWEYRQSWVRMTAQEKEQLAAHKPQEHSAPTEF